MPKREDEPTFSRRNFAPMDSKLKKFDEIPWIPSPFFDAMIEER